MFLSQQAAGKPAKAFLTFHQIAFRNTHDLADLGSQCVTADPSLTPAMAAGIADHVWGVRELLV